MFDFWYKSVGFDGRIIGMTTFGESAPAEQLFEMFGFTVENVVSTAQDSDASHRATASLFNVCKPSSKRGRY